MQVPAGWLHFRLMRTERGNIKQTNTYPFPDPDQSTRFPPSHLLKIHFHIVLPSIPRFCVVSFYQVSPPKLWVHHSFPPYVPHVLSISLFFIDNPNYICWGVELIMQSSPPPLTSSLLGPNIFVSTLFSNMFGLCFYFSVRDQASHPYKSIVQSVMACRIALAISVFMFYFFFCNHARLNLHKLNASVMWLTLLHMKKY